MRGFVHWKLTFAAVVVLSSIACGSEEKPAPVVVPPAPAVVVAPVEPVAAKDTDAAPVEAPKPEVKVTTKAPETTKEVPKTTTTTTTTTTETKPAAPAEPKTVTPAAPKTMTPTGPKTMTPGGTKTAPKTQNNAARSEIAKCCTALRNSGASGTLTHRAEYTAAAEACDGMKNMKDANNAFSKLRGILGTNKLPPACQ